jgi:hypothetical protein
MDLMRRLATLEGFEWDRGNRDKNRLKHGVQPAEAEEAFFNRPVLLLDDEPHSADEERYRLLGLTNAGRKVFVAFTLRHGRVRIISARDQSRQERRTYEKAEADPKVQE